MAPNPVTRQWPRKAVPLVRKAGAGNLQSPVVMPKARGVMRWPNQDWHIRCVGTTWVKKKMFIFVGKSGMKRQVQSTIWLTRTEALDAMRALVAR